MSTRTSKALLEKNSIMKRVLEEIRTHIIMNKYEAGHRLREIDLAAAYGASRGTIRAVFQELSNEGLVEFLDNGGCVVVGIDEKIIRDIYKLRMILEVSAAEIILESSEISILPMAAVMDIYTNRESNPLYHSNIQEFYIDLDIRLHQALVSLAGNRPILRAWSSMSSVIHTLLSINVNDSYQDEFVEKFYDRHQKLIDYAITRDPRLIDEIRLQIDNGMELSVRELETLRLASAEDK